MARQYAQNLTAEERRFVDAARAVHDAPQDGLAAGAEFQARVDAETRASAALSTDPEAAAVHDRVMDLPDDDFEEEFADVVHANAQDDDA